MTKPYRPLTALAGVVVLLLSAFAVGGADAAPKARLWERWAAHDPESSLTVDHRPWGRLLAANLSADASGASRFDYGAVGVGGRAQLTGYLEMMGGVPVDRLSRPQQFAYWINLYNALTVNLILEHYPVVSIRDIGGRLFSPGPWSGKIFEVAGVELSLDDIEHRILRPIWRDPRIHYAVNCAAVGCPDLAGRPFTAGQMEEMLDQAARGYINHPRGAAVDNGRLRVSSIYIWYKADFGGTDQGVISHLKAFAGPQLGRELAAITRIAGDDYDWSLNDRRK